LDQSDKLIVALDPPTYDEAAALVEQLAPRVKWFKVGPVLFTREGPRMCRLVKDAGARLFLDLKFHDIPNTVRGAVRSALDLGVDMLTLHAAGGPKMLGAAREVATEAGRDDVVMVAVTVLTHFDPVDFANLFASDRVAEDTVVSLAAMARDAGMTGVVASARELRMIKERVGEDCVVVTPGIRLPDAGSDDQTRVVTPEQAIGDGADYIVVGRPIIAAPDPAGSAAAFLERMAGATR
jgi:orotidine-5'-phosphate decarboxylase